MLQIDDKAPDFLLPDQNDEKLSLRDFSGRWIVLYFYPKDNTSGCTHEAVDFTSSLDEFDKMNAVVLGLSPDSTKSHMNFCKKHNLGVTLLSDTEHETLEKYGAWQLKKMYGREYYGVVRSTYLINPEGKIVYIWPKVKVKGHVGEVKKKLKELHK